MKMFARGGPELNKKVSFGGVQKHRSRKSNVSLQKGGVKNMIVVTLFRIWQECIAGVKVRAVKLPS